MIHMIVYTHTHTHTHKIDLIIYNQFSLINNCAPQNLKKLYSLGPKQKITLGQNNNIKTKRKVPMRKEKKCIPESVHFLQLRIIDNSLRRGGKNHSFLFF